VSLEAPSCALPPGVERVGGGSAVCHR